MICQNGESSCRKRFNGMPLVLFGVPSAERSPFAICDTPALLWESDRPAVATSSPAAENQIMERRVIGFQLNCAIMIKTSVRKELMDCCIVRALLPFQLF